MLAPGFLLHLQIAKDGSATRSIQMSCRQPPATCFNKRADLVYEPGGRTFESCWAHHLPSEGRVPQHTSVTPRLASRLRRARIRIVDPFAVRVIAIVFGVFGFAASVVVAVSFAFIRSLLEVLKS